MIESEFLFIKVLFCGKLLELFYNGMDPSNRLIKNPILIFPQAFQFRRLK